MGTLILERTVLRFDKGQESENKFIRELRKFEILADNGMYVEPKVKTVIKPQWMVPYITAFPLEEDGAADAFVAKVIETRKDQRKALEKSKTADEAPNMSNIMSNIRSNIN